MWSKKNWVLGFVFLVLSFVKVSAAVNRYVNDGIDGSEIYTTAAGVDGLGCGSLSSPCATMAYVVANYVLNLGDTVFIDEGIYTDANIVLNADTAVFIGAGTIATIFDGSGLSGTTNRLAHIRVPGVEFHNMSVSDYNNTTGGDGGAFFVDNITGDFTLGNVDVDGCQAMNGGAIAARKVSSGELLVIAQEITVTNGYSVLDGAGFYFEKTNGELDAYISSSVFGITGLGNSVDRDGGAIYFRGDTLTMYDVDCDNNSAGTNGGAIIHLGGVLIADSVRFYDNLALGNGGAIYGGVNTVIGISNYSEIGGVALGNDADRGAGIYFQGASININQTDFVENDAAVVSSNAGGGLYINNSQAQLVGVDFESNSAVAGTGGGLVVDNSFVVIDSSFFSSNTAAEDGGAIKTVGSGNLVIMGTEFGTSGANNGQQGGAIKFDSDSLSISTSTFEGNTAVNAGGAIQCGANSFILIDSTSFAGNQATGASGDGGALALSNSETHILNTEFALNSSEDNGGAIWAGSGNILSISDSSVIGGIGNGNVANNAGSGGAIWFSGDSLLIETSEVSYNGTNTGSGGAILLSSVAVLVAEDIYFGYNSTGGTANGGLLNLNTSTTKAYLRRCIVENNSCLANGIIDNSGDTLWVENCLMYDNTVGGTGVIFARGTSHTHFSYTTMANNTGSNAGLITGVTGSAEIWNSIFKDNNGMDINEGGSTIDVYNSLYETGTWAGANISNLTSDPLFVNQVGRDYSLQNSSPAIDHGDASLNIFEDINGNPRPSGPGYDAGAVESIVVYNGPNYFVNDAILVGDVYTANPGTDGAGCGAPNNPCATIQFVIDNYVLATGDTIFVDAGIYNYVTTTIMVDKPYIRGASSALTIIDGAGAVMSGFDIQVDTLYMSGLTIRDYHNTGNDGGGIHFSAAGAGKLWIDSVLIQSCEAANGGGVYLDAGEQLNMKSSNLLNNSVGNQGGAVYGGINTGVFSSISIIKGNASGDDGGAIRLGTNGMISSVEDTVISNASNEDGGYLYAGSNSTVSIKRSVIGRPGEGNTATARGGAIYFSGGTAVIDTTIIQENQELAGGMDTRGGAMRIDGGTTLFRNVIIRKNESTGDGGALHVVGGNVHFMNNSVLDSNTAASSGGALYFSGDTLSVVNSVVRYNEAGLNGGAMFVDPDDSVYFYNTSFEENNANNGGALLVQNTGGVFVDSAFFIENNVNAVGTGDGGGAIRSSNPNFRIEEAVFDNNGVAGNASADGGAVRLDQSAVIKKSVFFDNHTLDDGSAVFYGGTVNLELENSVFYNNTAGDDGVIKVIGSGTGTFNHNTIYGNISSNASTGGIVAETSTVLDISNSISFGNTTNDFDQQTATINVVNSVYQVGNVTDGGSNIVGDPLFTNQVTFDFTLQNSSPALDLADIAHNPGIDIEDNARPLGSGLDAGAYESSFGVCDTLTVTDAGDANTCGTLRFAMGYAITNPGSDTITFDTTAMGTHTIQPTTALPVITGLNADTTVIWGDLSNDGDPDVELDGSLLVGTENGINIQGSVNTIKGLVINQFPGQGIRIEGVGNTQNLILSNYIGLNYAGNTASGNGGSGISIGGATDNTIGGVNVADRNIISGNGVSGIVLGSSANNNMFYGNYIGTDKDGIAPVANTANGIDVAGNSANVWIGSNVLANSGNVISGNTAIGVRISGNLTNTTRVYDNIIGLNSAGTAKIPNGTVGISIGGPNGARIGDTTALGRNIISGNGSQGIQITGTSDLVNILGNYIGTDITGLLDLGNGGNGVQFSGGTVPQRDTVHYNTIAYNAGHGVTLSSTNVRNHRIYKNSIFSNIGLGINIVAGAQFDIQPPVITSIDIVATDTIVRGTGIVDALIHLYCDSAHEGQSFVDTVTVNGAGNWSININNMGVFTENGLDSLTALQDSALVTSEFSEPYSKTCTPLAGPYTIGGTTPDYLTFTAAVNDLQICGVSAPVVFDVRDGVYNEQIIIPYVTGVSAVDTILFRGESGDSSLVTLSFASPTSALNYVLTIDSSSHLSFQDMGFENTGTGNNTRCVTFGRGSSYLNFDHCRFVAPLATSLNVTTTARALIYEATTDPFTDIRFSNNYFQGGTNGINLASGSGSRETRVSYLYNVLADQSNKGIHQLHADSSTAIGNIITTSSAVVQPTYIALEFQDVDQGFLIEDNKINIEGGFTGIEVDASSGSAIRLGIVRNNTVIISGTDQSRGINIERPDFVNCFHNSVLISSTNVNSTAFRGDIVPPQNDVYVKNNIFSNTGGGYAIRLMSTGSNIEIDYNDLFATGINLGEDINTTTDYSGLVSWQGFGYDINSVSVDPVFTSGTDIHLSVNSPSVLLSGLDLTADVSDDIDGDLRATTPVMGADERVLCDTTNALTGTWTWTGAIDSDWFNCGNWDMGSLPNTQVTVMIPATTNNPLITGGTGYVQTITIDVDGGAVLSIDSDNLGVLEIHSP